MASTPRLITTPRVMGTSYMPGIAIAWEFKITILIIKYCVFVFVLNWFLCTLLSLKGAATTHSWNLLTNHPGNLDHHLGRCKWNQWFLFVAVPGAYPSAPQQPIRSPVDRLRFGPTRSCFQPQAQQRWNVIKRVKGCRGQNAVILRPGV